MTPIHTRAAGFTLLELMTGITVLGVLLAVGVPSFNNLIRNNRIAAQTNVIVGALNFARGQTGTRGVPVTMCAANQDLTGCANLTSWTNGWIVFTDRTGAGVLNTGEEILQTGRLGPGFNLNVSGNSVRFGIGATPTTPLNFTLAPTDTGVCATTGRRLLAVSNTGRITTTKTTTCS